MQLRDRILTPDSLRELTRMVNEELREDIGSIGDRLEATRSELAGLNRRLEKHYEALETGALSLAESGERIRELKTSMDNLKAAEFGLLEQLELSRDRRISETRVLRFASDLCKTLESGNVEQCKLFLAAFIEEVSVDDEGVEILYQLPVLYGDPGQSELEPVLQTAPQSGA